MERLPPIRKAIPLLVALVAGVLLGGARRIDTAPLAQMLGRLPIWPEPPTKAQLEARLEVAADELKRAEALVRHARAMLGRAKGLPQRAFWNRQIDSLQEAALLKREKYEAARKPSESFIDGSN